MAFFSAISPEDASTFAAKYPLGPLGAVTGIAGGSVNSNYALELGGRRYFLRLYEEQDARGAAREVRLHAELAAHGVPVARVYPMNDGEYVTTIASKPAALFEWRDGVIRCQRGVIAGDARAVGVALARVHEAGRASDAAIFGADRFHPDELRLRLGRIGSAGDPVLAAQAEPLRRALDRWCARRATNLPRGLVHGDLFRDNVLWNADGAIAALLDFESASEGTFTYDLAVTLLAWTFGDDFDPALTRALLAGYREVRLLTRDERDAFLAEACIAAIRFTITRITDYAMRGGDNRVIKDWRRFDRRRVALESRGEAGIAQLLDP